MSEDFEPPKLPWRERKCPVCGKSVTIQRFDGGTWVHGEADWAGCNAILKVDGDDLVCVARLIRIRGGW